LRTEFRESEFGCGGGVWFSECDVWSEFGILCASVVGSELVVVKVYMSGMNARIVWFGIGWKGKIHWRYTHMEGNGDMDGLKAFLYIFPLSTTREWELIMGSIICLEDIEFRFWTSIRE